MLRVQDLSVVANEELIIKGLSLEAKPGEPVFILGPNGSGKSTLLKSIVGIPSYRVVSGRIYLGDEDITTLPPWERVKRGLWLVHQSTFPLSIPTYFLLEKISTKRNSNVDTNKVLERLGIKHLFYREAFNGFSGGEAKKLELATAIISNSRYILLDEPDSGVDIDSLRIISQIINGWLREGRIIVIVTHLGAIANFIEREGKAYIIINGSIAYEGKTSDVLDIVLERGYNFFMGDKS